MVDASSKTGNDEPTEIGDGKATEETTRVAVTTLPGQVPETMLSPNMMNVMPASDKRIETLSTLRDRKVIKVYTAVNIVSLFSVDTIAETFTVRMVVRLIWCAKHVPNLGASDIKDDILHMIQGMEDADRDWKPEWYPAFGIRNRVETQEVVENFVAVCTSPELKKNRTDGEWNVLDDPNVTDKLQMEDFWIIRETAMNVVINSLEQLASYPFDVQELLIMIRMEHPTCSVKIRHIDQLPPNFKDAVPDHINVPNTTLTVNWKNLHTAERSYWPEMPCKYLLDNNFYNRAHGQECGACHVSIHVQRHMGHYVYNVFLIVFLITCMSGFVWAVKPSDIANRLATDATILLTVQAFKVAIADKLPKVSYLTLVDIYILFCFFFNLISAALHVRTGWQSAESQKLKDLDDLLLLVWCGAWAFFNLFFLFYCLRTRRKRFQYLRVHAAETNAHRPTVTETDVDQIVDMKKHNPTKHIGDTGNTVSLMLGALASLRPNNNRPAASTELLPPSGTQP